VLDPLVIPIRRLGTDSPLVPRLIAIVVLVATTLVVGASKSRIGGNRRKDGLDAAMGTIPGVRAIDGPLEQISTMLLEGIPRTSRPSSGQIPDGGVLLGGVSAVPAAGSGRTGLKGR